ncbi:Hypothetical_protein [Hexamita inflata]|uniref:Hypothetical_protein n=1 Tax=Hexamita inflata TaxID=28002 RepID=A0AA86U880_9EUKA|nr:Hypothetical protein HINF_LOCUS32714 [Hexamita inflata]
MRELHYICLQIVKMVEILITPVPKTAKKLKEATNERNSSQSEGKNFKSIERQTILEVLIVRLTSIQFNSDRLILVSTIASCQFTFQFQPSISSSMVEVQFSKYQWLT